MVSVIDTTAAGPLDLRVELVRLARFLRRRWRPVVLAALVGGALAAGHLVMARRVYRATARILVLGQNASPIRWTAGGPEARTEDKDALTTQAGVIASRVICERTIKRVGLSHVPSLRRGRGDPVDAALARLSVTCPDRTAKILQIDYTASGRDEATRFVLGLIETYREFLSEDLYRGSNRQVIDLINRSERELHRELDELQSRYVAFRRAHPGLTIGSDGKLGRTPNAERLAQLVTAAGELEVRAMRFRAVLELSRQLARQGVGLWSIAFAVSELGIGQELLRSVDSRGSSDHLRSLIKERQKLAEEHGPQVSKVLELDRRIARLQGEGEQTDIVSTMVRVQAALEATKAECDAKLAAALERVNDDELALLEESGLRNDLERRRALYNVVLDQLKQAVLVNNYSALNFRVIDEPRSGERPVSPNIKLELGLGLVGGALLGAVLAAAASRRGSVCL